MINKALIEIPPKFAEHAAGEPPRPGEDGQRHAAGRARQAWPPTCATTASGCATAPGSALGTLYPRLQRRDGDRLAVGAHGEVPQPGLRRADAAGAAPLTEQEERADGRGWNRMIDQTAKTVRLRGQDRARAKRPEGTQSGPWCEVPLSGVRRPVPYDHIARREANSWSAWERQLMAIVTEGSKSDAATTQPTPEHEQIAASAIPAWHPDQAGQDACGFRVQMYGMTRHR